MPIRRKVDIGFNRRVQATWLTETLRLTAAGVSSDEIETSLKEQIALENQGKETVRKVIVYLNRVWIRPPDYCTMLRDEALKMFRHRPDADSAFLLNWGMCMAAYPFIAHVAEATGRLLRLQGEAQVAQVNVRIRERFGDRHFVYRSVRYNLSTFLESGALLVGKKRGICLRGRVTRPRDTKEIAWLIEALLHSQDAANLSLSQIAAHGALFPFDLTDLDLTALRGNPRLDLFRYGLSETIIGLSM